MIVSLPAPPSIVSAAGAATDGVGTAEAIQDVVAAGAVQSVVGTAAGQRVGVAVTGQVVHTRAADKVLDRHEDVGVRGIAARAGDDDWSCPAKIDGECSSVGGIVGGIGVGTTIERIADIVDRRVQRVVAAAAGENVGTRIASQRVALGTARQVFNADERVLLGKGSSAVEVLRPSDRQGNDDPGRCSGIARRVSLVTTVQGVVAQAADQRVVAIQRRSAYCCRNCR